MFSMASQTIDAAMSVSTSGGNQAPDGASPSADAPRVSECASVNAVTTATSPSTAHVWAEHSVWPQDPQFPRNLEGGVTTLPMQLSRFVQAYENLYPPGVVNIFDRLNEAVKMSGTFLNIAPMLVMYFILQRWFVESVEKTGVTGE